MSAVGRVVDDWNGVKKMKTFGLIPARMESSRLPNKPLLDFWGHPMVVHVAKRAKLAQSLDRVIVCTDSYKIVEVCRRYKIHSCLTSMHCTNGTERIAEAAEVMNINTDDIIIDIQGDEPLVNPDTIDRVADFTAKNEFEVVVPYLEMSGDQDFNRVKIVSSGNRVVYMSRKNVPHEFVNKTTLKKHLSIVGFKYPALLAFAEHPPTELECVEGVELLRAIEIGISVGTFQEFGESLSVDSPDDYKRALRMMQKDPIFQGGNYGV